jgi:hypothetical protein
LLEKSGSPTLKRESLGGIACIRSVASRRRPDAAFVAIKRTTIEIIRDCGKRLWGAVIYASGFAAPVMPTSRTLLEAADGMPLMG